MLRIAAGGRSDRALALTAFLRFDSNPLDLRSPKVESVSTLFDLMKNPQTSPNTIDVHRTVAGRRRRAGGATVAQVPLVAQALTLSSFVPDDQDKKLALIADANNLLDSTLNPFDVQAAPSDAEIVASFKATAAKLRAAAGTAERCAGDACPRLADALDALAQRLGREPRPRRRGHRAGSQDHAGAIVGFADAAPCHAGHHAGGHAGPTGSRADGTARIQVFPKDTSNDPEALSAFSAMRC